MKKASIRDLHRRTGALVQEAADAPVAALGHVRRRTPSEAFRELEESGYFVRMEKTNSDIDRIISEDRDRF